MPHAFDQQSARRIAATVRRDERRGQSLTGRRLAQVSRFDGPRPALIQSSTKDGSNNRWTYSVKRAKPDTSGDVPVWAGFGEEFDAFNANEVKGGASNPVANGELVEVSRLNGVWMFSFGGGDSLPTPTALYQVLTVTRFVDEEDYDVEFDWPRVHA